MSRWQINRGCGQGPGQAGSARAWVACACHSSDVWWAGVRAHACGGCTVSRVLSHDPLQAAIVHAVMLAAMTAGCSTCHDTARQPGAISSSVRCCPMQAVRSWCSRSAVCALVLPLSVPATSALYLLGSCFVCHVCLVRHVFLSELMSCGVPAPCRGSLFACAPWPRLVPSSTPQACHTARIGAFTFQRPMHGWAPCDAVWA